MNQFFLDELICIRKNVAKKLSLPRIYCGNEINIIGDENALSAYMAAYNMMLLEESDNGAVNVITDGKIRNKVIYDEVEAEYGYKNCFGFLKNHEEYLESTSCERIKRFYYIANLQLEEYKDEKFVEEKLLDLEKWLSYAMKNDGRFIFVPIFNFAKPFPNGMAACSERELEALAEYDEDFYQGRILCKMEDICRKYFKSENNYIKVARFDNIFGPFVTSTSNLGIDGIIDELINDNKITFYTSDSSVYHTGCYIRQAVTAVLYVDYKGKLGNIYNAANYRFTMYDVKSALYKSFRTKNPKVNFVDDCNGEVAEDSYDCLGNIKIKNLGWNVKTTLKEGLYRTALAKCDEEYAANFYISVYQGKLDRVKALEMEIMAEIDRICKKHNITYFLVGGTLLGAVRHKGFIPWDDDMDIGMLRDDYDKFREVCPKELQSHLSYQSHIEEETSHYIFDKIRLKDTYFNTKFSNKFNDIQNGIFIDILVFDKTGNSPKVQKAHIKLIKIFRRLINVRWVNRARKGIHYRASKIFLPLMRRVPFKLYHRCFEKALTLFHKNKKSQYLIDGVGLNLEKGAFPAEWFGDFIDMEYENMTFKVPVGYDNYLRMWYGDRYMELLPLSSRFSGHKLLRLDLGKYILPETAKMNAHDNHLLGELYESSFIEAEDNDSDADEISDKVNKSYNDDASYKEEVLDLDDIIDEDDVSDED